MLVLVHCLSHIACGDLRDDSHPGFLKEFHHALAVMCDDLFFARYRRSSALARTLSSLPANDDLESASRVLLESVFGDAHTEADKSNVVEGLLDAKLLRGANKDGVHFTHEAIVGRLSKYSNFAVESKLRSFLGDVEDKASQARLQGTDEFIDKRLHELQGPQAKDRPVSRYVQSRGNLMTRGMSRAMATSRTATSLPIPGKSLAARPKEDEDLYKTFLQVCHVIHLLLNNILYLSRLSWLCFGLVSIMKRLSGNCRKFSCVGFSFSLNFTVVKTRVHRAKQRKHSFKRSNQMMNVAHMLAPLVGFLALCTGCTFSGALH